MKNPYHFYSINKKLSWYDKLSINIKGVRITKTLLDWYKHDPCAVLVDNVEQKGPFIAPAVYSKFFKHSCTCRERRTHHK